MGRENLVDVLLQGADLQGVGHETVRLTISLTVKKSM
jgi:hypothetical protein